MYCFIRQYMFLDNRYHNRVNLWRRPKVSISYIHDVFNLKTIVCNNRYGTSFLAVFFGKFLGKLLLDHHSSTFELSLNKPFDGSTALRIWKIGYKYGKWYIFLEGIPFFQD